MCDTSDLQDASREEVWMVCGCIRNRAATDSRGGMIDTKSS